MPRTQPAGRRLPLALAGLFVVLPLVEIVLLVLVGQRLGVWPVLGVVVATAALGAALMRREGMRSWRAIDTALRQGQVPTRPMSDAALALAGGVLLILPGLIGDVVGLLCLLPVTRALPRSVLDRWTRGRADRGLRIVRSHAAGATVIPGEVVDEAASPPSADRSAPREQPAALEGRVLD